MGGASSYWAMLSICGFLSAAWTASKVSRLVGVSSIVLEISTGVVLGPSVVGLITDEYAICEHKRHAQCDPPDDAEGIASAGGSLGFLDQYKTKDFCDLSTYLHHDSPAGHGGHSEGGNAAGDHAEGARAESGARQEEPHAGDGGQHPAQAEDTHHRRLSGGSASYNSFSECLQKTCESEVAHHCGLTPDIFTLIGHTGVALMIFESGMHFDFEKAKVVGGPACAVAVLGTILPLIAGTLLMMAFGGKLFPEGISAGTALAPTSVGIALRLLGEANVLQEDFGQAIITAAFVDDILSLVLFNVLFSLGGEFNLFQTVIAPIIGIAFMLVAMVMAVKFWPKFIDDMVMPQAPERRDANTRGWRRMKLERDELLFLLQIALLVVYSLITHLLGTHLWGCFIAGMSFACLSPPHHAHHVWVKQTKRMTTWMVRIFFCCTVAFSIPVLKLLSLAAFWKGSIMGVVACIATKVLCAPFMGPPRWVIGWAMVGRAEFAYLIAQMALSGNMLDEESFAIVIWALLYATIFAPFVFRYLLNKYVAREGLENASLKASHDVEGAEEHHDKGKGDKVDFAPYEGNQADLDIKEGNLKRDKLTEGYEEYAPQPTTMGAARAHHGRGTSAGAPGAGTGNGLLCCLFFKKIIFA